MENFDKVPTPEFEMYCEEKHQSSQRYVKSTLYRIPFQNQFLSKSKVPFGIAYQPLNKCSPREAQIERIKIEEVMRCGQCKAFYNKFFELQGDKFKCNLCKQPTPIGNSYIPQLLNDFATVDFLVDGKFQINQNEGNFLVFSIEITDEVVETGLFVRYLEIIQELV